MENSGGGNEVIDLNTCWAAIRFEKPFEADIKYEQIKNIIDFLPVSLHEFNDKKPYAVKNTDSKTNIQYPVIAVQVLKLGCKCLV